MDHDCRLQHVVGGSYRDAMMRVCLAVRGKRLSGVGA